MFRLKNKVIGTFVGLFQHHKHLHGTRFPILTDIHKLRGHLSFARDLLLSDIYIIKAAYALCTRALARLPY